MFIYLRQYRQKAFIVTSSYCRSKTSKRIRTYIVVPVILNCTEKNAQERQSNESNVLIFHSHANHARDFRNKNN